MYHGGSFLKLADDNMDIQNPEAQNREISGFWEKVIFLPFPHEKTTFQWPKVVSEAIFPTNRGYICIEKWSQIFVSGIGSAHSESEEKTLFQLKKWLFLTFLVGNFLISKLVIVAFLCRQLAELWLCATRHVTSLSFLALCQQRRAAKKRRISHTWCWSAPFGFALLEK